MLGEAKSGTICSFIYPISTKCLLCTSDDAKMKRVPQRRETCRQTGHLCRLLQRLRCRGYEGAAARSTSRRGEQPSTGVSTDHAAAWPARDQHTWLDHVTSTQQDNEVTSSYTPDSRSEFLAPELLFFLF